MQDANFQKTLIVVKIFSWINETLQGLRTHVYLFSSFSVSRNHASTFDLHFYLCSISCRTYCWFLVIIINLLNGSIVISSLSFFFNVSNNIINFSMHCNWFMFSLVLLLFVRTSKGPYSSVMSYANLMTSFNFILPHVAIIFHQHNQNHVLCMMCSLWLFQKHLLTFHKFASKMIT